MYTWRIDRIGDLVSGQTTGPYTNLINATIKGERFCGKQRVVHAQLQEGISKLC